MRETLANAVSNAAKNESRDVALQQQRQRVEARPPESRRRRCRTSSARDRGRERREQQRVAERARVDFPRGGEQHEQHGLSDRAVAVEPRPEAERLRGDGEAARVARRRVQDLGPDDVGGAFLRHRRWLPCDRTTAAESAPTTARRRRRPTSAPAQLSSAFVRPGCGVSSRMRLPMRIASGIECVTNTTVNRVSSQSCEQVFLHLAARQRVERRERLVHEQDLRLHRHRARDRDALLHAARQRVRKVVGELASGRLCR